MINVSFPAAKDDRVYLVTQNVSAPQAKPIQVLAADAGRQLLLRCPHQQILTLVLRRPIQKRVLQKLRWHQAL